MQYKLIITDKTAVERSTEVATYRRYDMSNTKLAYRCIDDYMIINSGDFDGLTDNEIASLIEYVLPAETK